MLVCFFPKNNKICCTIIWQAEYVHEVWISDVLGVKRLKHGMFDFTVVWFWKTNFLFIFILVLHQRIMTKLFDRGSEKVVRQQCNFQAFFRLSKLASLNVMYSKYLEYGKIFCKIVMYSRIEKWLHFDRKPHLHSKKVWQIYVGIFKSTKMIYTLIKLSYPTIFFQKLQWQSFGRQLHFRICIWYT